MSFWSENKGAFKSAGIATAKGIGSGTKALSKAGYKTYKNHDSSSKGASAPGEESDQSTFVPSTPLMDKDKLLALPAPPRRNVAASGVPTRASMTSNQSSRTQSAQNSYSAGSGHMENAAPAPQAQFQQAQQAPQQAPQQIPQQIPQQAPQYGIQQQPLQQPQQPQQPVPLPARDPQPAFQTAPDGSQITQPAPQAPPPRDYSQRAPFQLPDQQTQQSEQNTASLPYQPPQNENPTEFGQQAAEIPAQRVPKPAPDASMFSPPPVRVNTTAGTPANAAFSSSGHAPIPTLPPRSASSASSIPNAATANQGGNGIDLVSPPPSYTENANSAEDVASPAASTKSGAGEAVARAPVKYVEIDVTKFGPPPPRRVDSVARPLTRSGDGSNSSRGAVPPPPPRTLSANSTSSIASPAPIQQVVEKPKKVPPPKPAKLQRVDSSKQQLPDSKTLPEEEANAAPQPAPSGPSMPNFAAEIAKLRSRGTPGTAEDSPKAPTYSEVSNDASVSDVSSPPNKAVLNHRPQSQVTDSPELAKNAERPVKPPKPGKPVKLSQQGPGSQGAPLSGNNTQSGAKFGPPKPLVIPFTVERKENAFQPSPSNETQRPHTPEHLGKPKPPVKPKPLVLPFTVEQRPGGIQSPGSRIPVRGQFNHAETPEASANSGNQASVQKPGGSGPHGVNNAEHSVTARHRPLNPHHIPGYRVPVRNHFHHADTKEPADDNDHTAQEESNGEKPHPQPLVVPFTGEHNPVKIPFPGLRVPVFPKKNENINEALHGDDANVSRSTPPLAPPSRNSRNASNVPSASSTPPPPPPARNYTRAPAPHPTNPPLHPTLDLKLETGWYANNNSPLNLPADIAGLNYSTSSQTTTRSSAAGVVQENKRTMDLRLKDLSRMVVDIKWQNDDYANAISSITKYVPSPIEYNAPTKKQLQEYSEKFGIYVTSWCLRKEGQKVGSGECWDLARDALERGCGKHAFVSQYYHHGYPILELEGTSSGASIARGPEDEIRSGDILQFKSATIHNKNTGVTQTVGSPDHTAVVYEKRGDVLEVLEQNVQGAKIVRKGEYILANMTKGSVTVYRPVPIEWAG